MDELSNQFYFNKDYIMRLFKKEIHTTISDYINKKRIFQSLPDLQLTTNSILSIGLKHGFTSLDTILKYFIKSWELVLSVIANSVLVLSIFQKKKLISYKKI